MTHVKIYSICMGADIVLGIQACSAHIGGNSCLNLCISVRVYVAAVLIKPSAQEGLEQMDEGGGWAVTPPSAGTSTPR